jgi:hypothetical protein
MPNHGPDAAELTENEHAALAAQRAYQLQRRDMQATMNLFATTRNETFAQALASGVSQRRLAELTGLSKTHIRRLAAEASSS